MLIYVLVVFYLKKTDSKHILLHNRDYINNKKKSAQDSSNKSSIS